MKTVRVHRIAPAAFADTLFAGLGGRYAEGTWHTKGRPVVYAADSLSAAQLEIVVNYGPALFAGAWVKAVAEIPAALIGDVGALPETWRRDRPLTQALGDAWLSAGKKPVLRVPSKLTPGEFNFLLNPSHRGFAKIRFFSPEAFVFDERFGEGR